MFKKFFTIKKIWDGLQVFVQETIYHMRIEMRQTLGGAHAPAIKDFFFFHFV